MKVKAPLYQIRDRKGDSWQHQDKLKPCRERVVPLWLRRARSQFLSSLDQPGNSAEEQEFGEDSVQSEVVVKSRSLC